MSENYDIEKIQADVNKMISTALHWKAENATLKAENAELRAENAELKKEIEQLNAADM